jgi:adenylate kinase family enzyme
MNQDALVRDMIRTMKLPTIHHDTPGAVVFVGAPATGKTDFAKKLVAQLPLAYFSNEQIETYLMPHVSFFDDNQLTLEFSMKVITELLKQKVSVIYDFSIDKHKDREKLKEMIKEVGGQMLIVNMECEDEEVFHRIHSSNLRIVEGSRKGFILNQDYYLYKKSQIQSPLSEGAFTVKCEDRYAIDRLVALMQNKLSNPAKFEENA